MTNWQTIGFPKIKSFFEKAEANGGLSHAYLFTGQEMIGKRTFAIELADFLAGNPAGGANYDKLILDPTDSKSGQTIGIEEVREIKNFLSLSSYFGKNKSVIINDAHLMTDEAQNALLKVLEEPGSSSIFLLVSASSSLLLSTVLSRCQEIKFQPHSPKIVNDFLAKKNLPQSKIDFLLKFSHGRIGLAKEIIENDLFGEIKETIEELGRLAKADLNGRFTEAQKLSDDKQKSALQKKVLYWLLYMSGKITEPRADRILKGLLALNRKILQPQFNTRLALEEFLIKL